MKQEDKPKVVGHMDMKVLDANMKINADRKYLRLVRLGKDLQVVTGG